MTRILVVLRLSSFFPRSEGGMRSGCGLPTIFVEALTTSYANVSLSHTATFSTLFFFFLVVCVFSPGVLYRRHFPGSTRGEEEGETSGEGREGQGQQAQEGREPEVGWWEIGGGEEGRGVLMFEGFGKGEGGSGLLGGSVGGER